LKLPFWVRCDVFVSPEWHVVKLYLPFFLTTDCADFMYFPEDGKGSRGGVVKQPGGGDRQGGS
jgi:hypothetical protein